MPPKNNAVAAPTPARRFAEGTKVSRHRTMEELETILYKIGATDVGNLDRRKYIHVLFVLHGESENERRIRFSIPKPDPESLRTFRRGATGQVRRTDSEVQKAFQAEINRLYRALSASIKASLTAVAEGIETVEQAFWAHTLLPNGRTVFEETQERVALAIRTGQMPDLLPGLPENRVALRALPALEDLEEA